MQLSQLLSLIACCPRHQQVGYPHWQVRCTTTSFSSSSCLKKKKKKTDPLFSSVALCRVLFFLVLQKDEDSHELHSIITAANYSFQLENRPLIESVQYMTKVFVFFFFFLLLLFFFSTTRQTKTHMSTNNRKSAEKKNLSVVGWFHFSNHLHDEATLEAQEALQAIDKRIVLVSIVFQHRHLVCVLLISSKKEKKRKKPRR